MSHKLMIIYGVFRGFALTIFLTRQVLLRALLVNAVS